MKKAIFYDLQGTLGGEATANIDSFAPYPFAKEALSWAKGKGYLNIIITNQSKISKGSLPLEVYLREHDRILNELNSDELLIDEFLFCPHQSSDNCNCKKPKTALSISVRKSTLLTCRSPTLSAIWERTRSLWRTTPVAREFLF